MTAARTDDFAALPGMETANPTPPTAIDRSPGDAANTGPVSSKSALDALLDEYRTRAKSEREKGTLFGRRIVVDTPGAPWGNGFMKASHPIRRTEIVPASR